MCLQEGGWCVPSYPADPRKTGDLSDSGASNQSLLLGPVSGYLVMPLTNPVSKRESHGSHSCYWKRKLLLVVPGNYRVKESKFLSVKCETDTERLIIHAPYEGMLQKTGKR